MAYVGKQWQVLRHDWPQCLCDRTRSMEKTLHWSFSAVGVRISSEASRTQSDSQLYCTVTDRGHCWGGVQWDPVFIAPQFQNCRYCWGGVGPWIYSWGHCWDRVGPWLFSSPVSELRMLLGWGRTLYLQLPNSHTEAGAAHIWGESFHLNLPNQQNLL